MSIRNRSSEDYLHTNVILSKISEYDIFMYYCPTFKELNVKFCSELREDNRPSVSITNWNSRLLYKDFGHPEHTFDCFNYVRVKYNCSFIEALIIIDCDFNLGLTSRKEGINFTMGYMGFRSKAPKDTKKIVIIKKKKRQWNIDDADFWRKYLISKKILTTFAVEPISHYWVNANRFSCKTITYAFRFNNRYKIYSPLDQENKWLSNTKKTDVQGYKQLPPTGNKVYITSSLKDVMCLHAAGYNAVALQSETQMLEDKFINHLKDRFKEIIIFYDNDRPGQEMANKICDKYDLENIFVPIKSDCKDPSDWVAKKGNFNKLKSLLK